MATVIPKYSPPPPQTPTPSLASMSTQGATPEIATVPSLEERPPGHELTWFQKSWLGRSLSLDAPRVTREYHHAAIATLASTCAIFQGGAQGALGGYFFSGLAIGASTFLALGLVLRYLNPSFQDLPTPEPYSGGEELGTIGELLSGTKTKERDRIHDSLAMLHTELVHEEDLLRFLGYRPGSFSLQDLSSALSEIKVVKDPAFSRADATGMFAPDVMTILYSTSCNRSVLAHEFLHALHFMALARQMTRERMRAIVEFCEDTFPGIRQSGFKDDFDKTKTFLQGEEDIGAETRICAARLLWYLPGAADKRVYAKLEAVGSRFDMSLGDHMMRAGRRELHRDLKILTPMATLAGHTFQEILSGYSNPILYEQVLSEGLFGSLLPAST